MPRFLREQIHLRVLPGRAHCVRKQELYPLVIVMRILNMAHVSGMRCPPAWAVRLRIRISCAYMRKFLRIEHAFRSVGRQ